MIDITDGDAHDVAAIMPVMQSAFDPEYGESWSAAQCIAALAMPNSGMAIARRGNSPIGFAITRWVLDQQELLMIGVAPEAQREGVGKSIIDYVTQNFKQSGRKMLFLEVRDGNPAYHFYQELGFTEMGRRKNYYRGLSGAKHDAITMAWFS